ncbi:MULTISPECIES: histidine phosphatase family protein [Lacrimispora]|uniref:histidine phosphatase family protein n=1 Tax=Lacrimispora TaxID=2719231 RepID=UPI000BE29163|nr:histidine phosphatase family protein [Lacrimispora amygdalina]
MTKRIYLIRHGKIHTGNEKRYLGITDLPLIREGIDQAEALMEFFQNMAIDFIFTSPLKRCRETAEIISGCSRNGIIEVQEFKEINLGLWENKPMQMIKGSYPDAYEERGKHLLTFQPPGGESFGQLAERVLPAFEHIVKQYSGNIIIIAHAGVNRTILSKIQGISIHDFFLIEQPYGCIYEIRCMEDSGYQVEQLTGRRKNSDES